MSRGIGTQRIANPSDEPALEQVMDHYLSRRRLLRSSLGSALGLMVGSALGGLSPLVNAAEPPSKKTPLNLGFESIRGSRTHGCVVPAGYKAQVLAPWGTPLTANARLWQADGSNSAADQAQSAGMHHDGMHYFPIDGKSNDGLLAVNYEYIDEAALHPSGPTRDANGKRPAEEVRKEINAHGAGIMRVQNRNGEWQVVQGDTHNRRFTTATVMDIAGPLRGSAQLQTPFSPNGTQTRGTNNNCGNGYTPWGTYLTCEENWPEIFVNRAELTDDQKRLIVQNEATLYGWETAAGDASEVQQEFARFDITPSGKSALEDYRNEANGYGYIVEIDPYNASTRAVKRTALGRFRHEGCCPSTPEAGKPLVFYMGDDARHEYLYKFVSKALWDPADANRSDRLAVGAKYMDEGTLYVARFDDNGRGAWLPLTLDSRTKDGKTLAAHFKDLPAIILNTRGAADLLGATPMDRPEWTAVNPVNGDVYLTLTNNNKRTEANVANPRVDNRHGHIIRWHDDADQRGFNWDIFVFGANAADASINHSGLTELNQFASPDGLAFDGRGILWIQTDNGEPTLTDYTNDQMLAVIPANLTNAKGQAESVNANNQNELRRFFVGPNGSEVTGIAFTPDHRTLFINIQHPVNWPASSDATAVTPDGQTLRPRSSTVAIQRLDGGPIGV